jgi:8-oxo-dGTP diphosphatase
LPEAPPVSPRAVVAALIWRSNQLLICQRKMDDAFPGKWEFPGGKLEPGEVPRDGLARELFEELNIRARIGREVWQTEHQYPGRAPVHLLFFEVTEFAGEPENRVFEQILWVAPGELGGYDFLDADQPLIALLAERQILGP